MKDLTSRDIEQGRIGMVDLQARSAGGRLARGDAGSDGTSPLLRPLYVNSSPATHRMRATPHRASHRRGPAGELVRRHQGT